MLIADGNVDRRAAIQALVIGWPAVCYAYAHCPAHQAEGFEEIYHAQHHVLDRLGLLDADGNLDDAKSMAVFEQGGDRD